MSRIKIGDHNGLDYIYLVGKTRNLLIALAWKNLAGLFHCFLCIFLCIFINKLFCFGELISALRALLKCSVMPEKSVCVCVSRAFTSKLFGSSLILSKLSLVNCAPKLFTHMLGRDEG